MENVSIFLCMNGIPVSLSRKRDKKGRFLSTPQPLIALNDKIKNCLIGDLLGDGHLRFTHKDQQGVPSGNAIFAITLKSKEHIMYLWDIYKDICTNLGPRPWPNPNTGLPVTQYVLSSKALPSLSELHSLWYVFNSETKKFTKILPLNIGELLTPIGLAMWAMGDGYWDTSNKTLVLCTDNFTLIEVELLIKVLEENFNLKATVMRRIKKNKELCWRIRLSSKSENISKLRSLIQPYFIPSMLYKLNL